MNGETKPDEIAVNVPVIQQGTIEILNKSAVQNPAPDKLKRVLTAIRYTFVSLITTVSGTDLVNGRQAKIISFCLGVCIILCGAIEVAVGVKPIEEK